MKQITTLLLLLVTLAAQSVWAQKLSVESFIQDQRKVYGSTEARLDGTGEQYCALVLVQLPTLQGVTFDGEIVNPIEPRGGEYWVYMVAGSKYLRIKHPSVHPLEVTFADYGIASLQSKATYVLTINVPQLAPGQQQDDGMTYVSFTVEPANATLMIDGELQDTDANGEMMRRFSRGHHTYEIQAKGFSKKNGSFELGLDKLVLREKLVSTLAQLDITCPTPGADILIDEKLRGKNSHWSGSMAPGTYMLEARKEGYYPQQKSVSLSEKQNLKVEIPALVQRTGMLDIAYKPANTEVYLDGQKLGTSPDIFRNVPVGSHQIELRMEGYQSVTQRVTIEEGKTASLSGSLAQKTTASQTSATAANSAKQSEAQSLYDEGEKYYYGRGVTKDYAMAVSYFKKAAEMGYAEAQNRLGYCYGHGLGVEQNYTEAVKWYRMAADQGNARAQNDLGVRYENGQGVEKNYTEAAKWYRMAAEQGDATAQSNLGVCYKNGIGVEKNYTEAVKWYRKAAEQGNAKAQNNLGYCYENGQGVEKNYTEAAKWYRMAAEQGYVIGQYNLGYCYRNGIGVETNLDEAVKWYRKAAEQGDEDAKKALQRLGK